MELLFQLFLLVVVRKRKRSFQQCWIFCCFAQLSGAVIRPTYLGFLATRSQANDFDNGARFGKCCRIDLRKCHFLTQISCIIQVVCIGTELWWRPDMLKEQDKSFEFTSLNPWCFILLPWICIKYTFWVFVASVTKKRRLKAIFLHWNWKRISLTYT